MLLEGLWLQVWGRASFNYPQPVWQAIRRLHDSLLTRTLQCSAAETAHPQNLITTTHARVMTRTTFASVAREDASLLLLRAGGGGAVGGGDRRGTAIADIEAVGRALRQLSGGQRPLVVLHDNVWGQIASPSAD